MKAGKQKFIDCEKIFLKRRILKQKSESYEKKIVKKRSKQTNKQIQKRF